MYVFDVASELTLVHVSASVCLEYGATVSPCISWPHVSTAHWMLGDK